MTLHPSKLAAARLAAAEVFIAEGLQGTNWSPEPLRRIAAEMDFRVRYQASFAKGSVDIHVDEQRGEISVRVEPRHLDSLSPADAFRAADQIRTVAEIARKVEAAIARAVDGSEA
ncbi:hypothetical protein [Sorangium sp. So ce1024]|uniref:hypothetical protein n=1 Tax=Sorangium sp. So ce1024 TaxID=3133327 RepID=UPI003F05C6C2